MLRKHNIAQCGCQPLLSQTVLVQNALTAIWLDAMRHRLEPSVAHEQPMHQLRDLHLYVVTYTYMS